MTSSREWSTFLRIPSDNTSDLASALDSGWCAARGVNTGAATVLRMLRDDVSPVIRNMMELGLDGFHFACHDRTSGVPAPEGDNGVFIHLRLFFKNAIVLDLRNRSKFEMTRPIVVDNSFPGGIDSSITDILSVRRLINAQSRWVLDLIEAHTWRDDALMIRQVQQFGHFFANMLQMRLA